MIIEIGNKQYNVEIAKTEEEKVKGLQGRKSLAPNEGMLFIYDSPQTIAMWMKDTQIPLDIVFINEDEEVISVYQGQPLNEDIIEEDNVKYVLEVNQNSGIEEGDELELELEDPQEAIMHIIGPDGQSQMDLVGGERIFSRISTKVLIKKAKKAEANKKDESKYRKYCKALGKYMFKELKNQDNREPEYVTKKD